MAFKMKGSPMKRNFGVGTSPVKQRVATTYTDEDLEGGKKKVTTVKGRENKKGQSQSDVMNMRWKKYQAAADDLAALGEKITKYGKEKFSQLSDKKQKEIIANLKSKEKSVKDMRKSFVHSADSISTRNIHMDKAADEDWD